MTHRIAPIETRDRATTPLGRWALCVAIVAMWAQGWAPSLANVLANGRGYVSGLQSTTQFSSLGSSLDSGLTALALAALVAALFSAAHLLSTARIGAATLLIVLWFIITGGPLLAGTVDFSIKHLITPVAILVLTISPPPRAMIYKLLAALVVITAAGSVAFALVSPAAFMSDSWSAAGDKGILDTRILAGPYSHSNALGLTLALGLPIITTRYRGALRVIGLSVTAFALLWSASRISVAVAVTTVALSLITLYMKSANSRAILTTAAVAFLGAVLLLPQIVTNPTFLTNRGMIWMSSREYGWENPIFGHSSAAFTTINPLTEKMQFLSSTGHNASMTFWVTGGLAAVLLLSCLLFVALRNARQVYAADRTALLFLTVLIATCIAEDPIRALTLSPQSFILLPMFALTLLPAAALQATSTLDAPPHVALRRERVHG